MTPKRFSQLLRNSLAFLAKFGVRRFAQECRYRLVNDWNEWRLNVQTDGLIRLPDIGIHNDELFEYVPIGYSAIYSAIRRIPLSASSTSFIDYGSGKGRAIVAAASFPFKKVLGVEISPDLNNVARDNVKRMRHRKAEHIDLIRSDAAEFVVPDDANLIYMFNPFRGATLKKVIDNILASYNARRRTIYIIYFNKIDFEQLIENAGYHLIKRIHLTHVYPNYSCGIYEIAYKSPTEHDANHA
jgi:predicted RNA methylase